jgi:hypothetical protein
VRGWHDPVRLVGMPARVSAGTQVARLRAIEADGLTKTSLPMSNLLIDFPLVEVSLWSGRRCGRQVDAAFGDVG